MSKQNYRNLISKRNNAVYNSLLDRMLNIAIGSIGWENLPYEINESFIERTLINSGHAIFFQEDIIKDYICLPVVIGGELDIYGESNYLTAKGVNGATYEGLNKSNSVIIYNNYTKTSCIEPIRIFADLLYEIDRAITTNVKSQKTPYIIKSTEQQRLTMENLYNQIDDNLPVIFTDKMLDTADLNPIDIRSVYVGDNLQRLKEDIWNEFLSYIGVENSRADKNERLVADEVGANYGYIERERNTFLTSRIIAAEKINRMFGLNIEPYFKSDLPSKINMPELYTPTKEDTEGKTDEPIHNPS